jgi:hypothetical protein
LAVLSELKRIVSAERLGDTHGVAHWLVDKKQLEAITLYPSNPDSALRKRRSC